ncbi:MULTISPECIES: DJ-1/PfpI family protein [Bacillus]|uniref:DJ-1/PfpI family protein n=1 Tax=Bacillus TaxID=1386 RepID=UPI0002D61E09|nr:MULTISPECIES: DJ-1/PfpI family protein [Bacillus]
MSKKVLIVTGDAVEALELMYPYYRCLEEDVQCTIASPVQKKLQTVVHDFIPEMETYTEKLGYVIESHTSVDSVDPAEYDGLIIPGGRAPEYIRLNSKVQELAAHFLIENKPIGVICHGSLVLTTVREYIKGRTMTAYPACRPEVEAGGATFSENNLYVEDNIVSGQAWPDLPGFMKEFLKLLNK